MGMLGYNCVKNHVRGLVVVGDVLYCLYFIFLHHKQLEDPLRPITRPLLVCFCRLFFQHRGTRKICPIVCFIGNRIRANSVVYSVVDTIIGLWPYSVPI
jgi:hypothetical protein